MRLAWSWLRFRLTSRTPADWVGKDSFSARLMESDSQGAVAPWLLDLKGLRYTPPVSASTGWILLHCFLIRTDIPGWMSLKRPSTFLTPFF